jgi:hypothetical protein
MVALNPVQEWEGVVTEVSGDDFEARLHSAGRLVGVEETALFPRAVVPKDDVDLLKVGAIFSWSISAGRSPEGHYTATSEIKFRRHPVWSERDIALARSQAERWRNSIRWE